MLLFTMKDMLYMHKDTCIQTKTPTNTTWTHTTSQQMFHNEAKITLPIMVMNKVESAINTVHF